MPRKTVKLEHGVECLAEPCFIIEQDGALYLAVAVLEYNAPQATSPKKEEGVAHVSDLFAMGVSQAPLRACALNDDGSLPPPSSGKKTQQGSSTSEAPRPPGGPSVSGGPGGPSVSGGPGGPSGPGGPGGPPHPPPIDPPPPPGPPGVQTEPPGVQTSP